MVITRKMVLMALHPHLIKTKNFHWANAVLRYLHGFKVDKTEIWVINLALRMVSLEQFQIPKEF